MGFEASSRGSPRQRTAATAAVAVAAVLLYLQTVGFGLVNYDDPWLIASNRVLSEPSVRHLRQVLFDLSPELRLRLGSEYLPVRDLSVMADFAIFGRWYQGFHLTNVLLYGALCALLLRMLLAWSNRLELALAAALLYLSHPLHVESVAWLSERKGLLAALLTVACALVFRGYLRSGGLGRWCGSAALLLLGCWSKGVAVAGVGLVVALVWFWGGELTGPGAGRRRAWAGCLGLAGVALAAWVPLWVVGQRMAMVAPHHGGGAGATALLMGEAHALYLKHAALLGELGIRYPIQDAARARPWAAAVGGLALAGILALLVVAAIRSRRGAVAGGPPSAASPWSVWGVAAALWVVFLLPVSQLLLPLQNLVADRYLLLPSAGWCLALAALLQQVGSRRMRHGLLAALVAVQGVLAAGQTRAWASDRALYEQALRAHPHNVAALLQLARLEREAGRAELAARWLDRAQAVSPDDSRVLLHRALQQLARGDAAGAIALLRRAVRDPMADRARANLALLLMRGGQHDEALRWARGAARIRPLKHHNQHTLGTVALNAGRVDEARRALERALELRPDHAATLYNLALAALRRGDEPRALALARRALRAEPGHAAAAELVRAIDAKRVRQQRQVRP